MATQTDLKILIIDDNVEIHKDFLRILTVNSSGRKKLDDIASQLFDTDNGNNEDASASLPQFQIDTASQGQEGVARIAKAIEEKEPYALAFVDIRMPPGWDGIETIKHIWELDSDIQIVICTAYSDYSWEETIAELGQRDNLLILKKPFDNVAVRQLSCALTKKWQLMRDTREHTHLLEHKIKERTQALQASLTVTRGTLESSVDGILVVDTANKIIDYNHKLLELWNISSELIASEDANQVISHIIYQLENPRAMLEMQMQIHQQPETINTEKWKTQDHRFFEFYSQPYLLEDKIAGRIWCFRDITKRAELEERLQYQATHDALTGLPNRVLLTDRINQAITNAKRNPTVFGVIFFDLDRFKLVNDSLSHTAGDELLREVSKRITYSLREEDSCSRLGGDEFVVLSRCKEKKDIGITAQRIIEKVFGKPFVIGDMTLQVTASMGISVFPDDGQTVDALLKKSDIAMYHAKSQGGNQHAYYNERLNEQNCSRLEVESELRRALTNNELFIAYQPQLDLTSQQVVSVEALVRWQHPVKGVLLPIHFIPLAEETDLIIRIGEWVLREACRQNKAWQDMGLPKIRVAVNVTSQQLKQPDLNIRVQKILQETGLEPEYLELELTENVILSNIEAINVLNDINNQGIHIALDDFGTGYSCLNYLRTIPVDRIKIDQSFIRSIDVNRSDEAIIQAIISMASNLGLKITAEGVESKNQLDFLKRRKCSDAQGFYFSQPLKASDLEDFFKTHAVMKK